MMFLGFSLTPSLICLLFFLCVFLSFDFETIIFFSEGRFLKESDAVISILFKIGGFNRLISRIISLLPVKFRNILYKFISRNRYRLFGKQQDCMIPEEPIKKRFL